MLQDWQEQKQTVVELQARLRGLGNKPGRGQAQEVQGGAQEPVGYLPRVEAAKTIRSSSMQ